MQHLAAKQLGEQTATNERALAAAGGADDRDKAIAAETLQQFDRLFFATKEQVVFFLRKRPQTWKRIHFGVRRIVHTHTSLSLLMNASSSTVGANSSPWWITSA